MSFLTINCNISFIYVLIYWLLEIFVRLIMYYKWEYFKISDDAAETEYMFLIYPSISKLFSGILIIYINCVVSKKSGYKNKNKVKLIYKNPIGKKTKYYYLKLLLISFLEILSYSFYFIFFLFMKGENENISSKTAKDVFTLLDIIIRYILSIIILKIKIFKHHIWSIFAIIIGFFLIVPFDICDVYFEEEINNVVASIYIGVISLKSVFYPLENTYVKKFFNEFYVLPEYLLFSIGVVEVIIFLIITPILYALNVLKFNFNFGTEIVTMTIIYIFTKAVREYILIKFIYLFSSQFVAFLIISLPISGSIMDIINFIRTKDKSQIPVYAYISFPFELISLGFIIFGTLMYDEIIIVNKFGLNFNVKKGIIERALIDTKSTIPEEIEPFDDTESINATTKS